MADRSNKIPQTAAGEPRYVNRFALLDPRLSALREYALWPPPRKLRGRPRKPPPVVAKRSRGRPKYWIEKRYRELLDLYEKGRTALLAEGVQKPTDRLCMERGAQQAVKPPLTPREARQVVKEFSLLQRLSEARASLQSAT